MAKSGLILLFLLSGCTTTSYITVCPEPPLVTRPDLEVQYLKEGDGPDRVIEAHRTTIKQLQGYSVELETILQGYKK